MKITYLGTGSAEGIPAPFCHCPTCLRAYQYGGHNFRCRQQVLINEDLLIDFSPDTHSHHLFFPAIRSLLLTHSHSDHFYLNDLALLQEVTRLQPMQLWGNEMVVQRLNAHHVACQRVALFQPFSIDDYLVIPLAAHHSRREEALIYVIQQGGHSLLYAHDTGWLPEATWRYLQHCQIVFDVVSVDCTYSCESKITPTMTGHMNLAENNQLKAQLSMMGCITAKTLFVASHFSHRGGMLHHELEHCAPPQFIIAYDGMVIKF